MKGVAVTRAVVASEGIVFEPRTTPMQVTPTPKKSEIDELETAMYIVSQASLSD